MLGIPAVSDDDIGIAARGQHSRSQIEGQQRRIAGHAKQPWRAAMREAGHEARQRAGVVGQAVGADLGSQWLAQLGIGRCIAIGIDEQGADLRRQALQCMQCQWQALKALQALVHAAHARAASSGQHAAGDLLRGDA
jgi:hypothetical protein